MDSNSIQVTFKYHQIYKGKGQNMEKIVTLKPDIPLTRQWEDVAKQLEFKKFMRDFPIQSLYPVKKTSETFLNYFEIVPVNGDTIALIDPVGIRKELLKTKKCRLCCIFR